MQTAFWITFFLHNNFFLFVCLPNSQSVFALWTYSFIYFIFTDDVFCFVSFFLLIHSQTVCLWEMVNRRPSQAEGCVHNCLVLFLGHLIPTA